MLIHQINELICKLITIQKVGTSWSIDVQTIYSFYEVPLMNDEFVMLIDVDRDETSNNSISLFLCFVFCWNAYSSANKYH